MKKYEVTEEHGWLKAGLVLDQKSKDKDSAYFIGNTAMWIVSKDIEEFKLNGWIKEIEEPEFTRRNMAEFGQWVNVTCRDESHFDEVTIKDIDNWINYFREQN